MFKPLNHRNPKKSLLECSIYEFLKKDKCCCNREIRLKSLDEENQSVSKVF